MQLTLLNRCLTVALLYISAMVLWPLQEIKINGFAQGTTYSLSYYAPDSLVTKAQIDSILTEIDKSMSLYRANSTINRFNKTDKGLDIDLHFATVVKRAFEIYKDTDGSFDITVAPLVQLWGFGPKKINVFPDSAAIKKIMPCIGMDKLQLNHHYLSKQKPCINIDLNGIAQGYTVDVIAAFLQLKGIKSYLVEVGGELRVKGAKPDGKLFLIGIEGPAKKQQHTVQFKEGAITTSGNYERYLMNKGQKISHLIDPKTGYPLKNEMISVTVYAKDAITADGYDNALMAMSVDQALAFVAKRKNLETYIIYKRQNGEIADTLSAGFKKIIVN